MGTRAVAFNEKDCGAGAVLGRWLRLLADRWEPAERTLNICALGGGDSTVLLLPALLLDASEQVRARLDIVSCRCWRCFVMEVDSEVWVLPAVAGLGGCGIGFSPLLVSFPSEDEGSPDGVMLVRRRKPIAVSDLYRGSVGGTAFVADALTPAEAECDRRRPGTGTVSDCVIREEEMGKGVVISEFGG